MPRTDYVSGGGRDLHKYLSFMLTRMSVRTAGISGRAQPSTDFEGMSITFSAAHLAPASSDVR